MWRHLSRCSKTQRTHQENEQEHSWTGGVWLCRPVQSESASRSAPQLTECCVGGFLPHLLIFTSVSVLPAAAGESEPQILRHGQL